MAVGLTNRAVFVDKDGTLIPDVPYNVNPALITLASGAGQVLAEMQQLGYLLVVVSNQSGVARGLFAESALSQVHARLRELLAEVGVTLHGFYYCPHLPDAAIERYAVDCNCRKPKAGMLRQAASDLNIDLTRSWMIGDIVTDSEAGNAAGCHTLLIEKDYDPLPAFNVRNRPHAVVSTWAAASRVVLQAETWLALPARE